jgi:hypothetical protein
MTIEYIADQIVLMVSGGRPTVEGLDKREIIALCKEAQNIIGRQEYFENYKAMNQHTVQGQWLVSYRIALSTDAIFGYKQAVLPVAYINLPKNRGFVSARIAGNVDKNRLTPIDFEYWERLKESSLLHYANKFYVAPVAEKIYVLPGCDQTIRFTDIIVTLAVATDATLTESQALLIIERVLPEVRLRMSMPADMITDQNPNVK